ncbi:unnamed protein product [Rotaria sp. Silwood2]|nr:unnamed protein product [Rotaria sp. Silwood2]
MSDEDGNTEEDKLEILAIEKSPASAGVEQKKKKLKKGVFNREWLKISEYQVFLKEYKFDSSQATCVVCNQQFSIHYRGKADIDNHMKTKKHEKNMKSYNVNQQLITDTIKPSKEKDEICAAEAVLVFHGVKHGHSYVAQQCLTDVCKTIFSSSTVANHLSCGQTKSTSIVLNVLAPYFTRSLFDDLKQSLYYSLHFDASNKGNTKVYPFCVQFLSLSGVKKGIVNLIDDANESANGIFVNARADNTNVNVGENHSVYSLFKEESPDILKGNCYSHILHNSVKHAHRALPIDVEQILLSIYSHFSRSTKCINELKQYYEIITSIKSKLQERIDSDFFGAACRYRLARLPSDIQKTLKTSFIEFLRAIICYIDSYFDQNVTLYQTISYFDFQNIESLTWNQVIQCVDLLKIKGLNDDCLFDEFTNIKSTLKIILQQRISVFNLVQTFINKQGDIAVTNECKEEKNDDDADHSENRIVRSDQFWINAYVESAFSQLKYLCNDKRNCMTIELLSAELKIRLNSSLSCIEMYKHVLSNQDLLKAIKSDENYAFKRKCI